MVKVRDIYNYLNSVAPIERKMDFDNVGILAGNAEQEVRKVIVALDINDVVVDECVENGADLIVSHHPVIFHAMKSVTEDDLTGRKIIKMIRNNISAICMHTNLDVSNKGVNDNLAMSLGLENIYCPYPEGTDSEGNAYGLMRCGSVKKEMSLNDFLKHVKDVLGANGLRYTDAGRTVKKVAVVGGAGGSEIMDAHLAGCDTYVTADVKHNGFIDACELGMNLIDAGHFPTENGIVDILCDNLKKVFPEIEVTVSSKCVQTEKFYS